MPPAKVIPPDREESILARAGKGESADKIAVWLSKELGRKVDGRRVREFLEKVRKDRAPIAEAVIADKVGKTVGSDLDALQDMLEQLDDLHDRMDTAGDLRGAIAALREKHALVKTRLELNGGNTGKKTLEELILAADRKLREAADKA